MKTITIISIICVVLFAQCKKHSSRWLTAEIHIIDAESGEPVKGRFNLRYYEGFLFGSEERFVELGSSDDNGLFEIERSINRKDSNFKLELFAGVFYEGFKWPLPSVTKELSQGSHNKITFELDRAYALNLNFNNTFCYDETDSLWLVRPGGTLENPHLFSTGCFCEYEPETVFHHSDQDTATFISITKKNGVYDTLYHHYTMEFKTINEFDLNY